MSVPAISNPGSVSAAEQDDAKYVPDIMNNPLWFAVAQALDIDGSLTHKEVREDHLHVYYQKWNAYVDAWGEIQRLKKNSQWAFPSVGKTELVNLFG